MILRLLCDWGAHISAFGVCTSSMHKGSCVPVPAQGAVLVYIELNSNPSLPNCLPLFVAWSITIYEEKKLFFPLPYKLDWRSLVRSREVCSSWVIASGQVTASNSELCVALPFHVGLALSMIVRAPVCLCSLWGMSVLATLLTWQWVTERGNLTHGNWCSACWSNSFLCLFFMQKLWFL